jgi:RNA polymerase sigma-70 factor (ECF subfamily)
MTVDPVEREYARLVERHRDELHAHSRRILRSSQDAEDALQEALLRGWRALPSFEGRSSLRSWLYRIVTNTSLDTIKGRSMQVVPIEQEPPAVSPETDPEDRYARGRGSEPGHGGPGSPREAARGLDHARGAGLLGRGDRRSARDDGCGG